MRFVRSRSKYGNKKTYVNGISFHSKAEAMLYQWLVLLEKSGSFRIKSRQEKVYLSAAKILYKPDFVLEARKPTGEYVTLYIECKGAETPSWKLKGRLWNAYRPHDSLLVYAMVNCRPVLRRVYGKNYPCVFSRVD